MYLADNLPGDDLVLGEQARLLAHVIAQLRQEIIVGLNKNSR